MAGQVPGSVADRVPLATGLLQTMDQLYVAWCRRCDSFPISACNRRGTARDRLHSAVWLAAAAVAGVAACTCMRVGTSADPVALSLARGGGRGGILCGDSARVSCG